MEPTDADLELVAGQEVGSCTEFNQTQVTAIWTEGEAREPQASNPYAIRQIKPDSGLCKGAPPHLKELTERPRQTVWTLLRELAWNNSYDSMEVFLALETMIRVVPA